MSAVNEPAGEMWSVVMKSPSSASTRAFSMGASGASSRSMPSKYGAGRTYVEPSSHSNRSLFSTASERHASSPSNRPAEPCAYRSAFTNSATSFSTSAAEGCRSVQYTGLPSASVPSASCTMSKSTVPASAYATTMAGAMR